MLVIQLQPREADVVGVAPAGQQLELEDDCAVVKEERRPHSGRGDRGSSCLSWKGPSPRDGCLLKGTQHHTCRSPCPGWTRRSHSRSRQGGQMVLVGLSCLVPPSAWE